MISIHALREEGDLYPVEGDGLVGISIHALREEGDQRTDTSLVTSTDFYPRPPRGGRPEIDSYLEETKLISIHALREEGDWATQRR